jgi:signal transduction histidine kinase
VKPKRWTLLQLLFGWIPIGALFATMILTAHPGSNYRFAVYIAARCVLAAALLGFMVYRLTRRVPWPRRFHFRFAAIHFVSALVYSTSWILLNSVLESAMSGRIGLVVGNGLGAFFVMGIWIYIMIMGVSYAAQATERAVRAESLAAGAQLEALRSQLNPHFLFNALHTVVQLIPRDPARAATAAEQLAVLLRATVEGERDLVTVEEEWAFVQRYLEIEKLRFGERLLVNSELDPTALDQLIPSYTLQTLVENAVRHGASAKVDTTTIDVSVRHDAGRLHIRVADNGAGAPNSGTNSNSGINSNGERSTGLSRLRERARVLHGPDATLSTEVQPGGGFVAEFNLPVLDDARE